MPRNGSGTYSLYTPGNPVVTGTTISSTWANNTLSDIGTALTNSIAKDGQTTPTANLPMGTFKFTGLGAGSAATDSLNLGQAQGQAYLALASVAGTDTITASASPSISAYATGQTFRFVAANTNTGAVTININGAGAKSVTKNGATALSAGDIEANAAYQIYYDGTQFQLTGSRFNGGTITSDITMSSATMIWSKGADVASATALPLITDGNYFDVTGTTTITSMNSMGVGTWIGLQFDGALTLTHNATSLILPGGANITTAAGDEAIFVEYSSGNWRCVSYQRAAGLSNPLVSGTSVSASGTSVDFTGIPSWVKKITIPLSGLSTNGTSIVIVQIGSGSPETSGYLGSYTQLVNAAAVVVGNFSSGIIIDGAASASAVRHGAIVFTLIGSNTWAVQGSVGRSDTNSCSTFGGSKALSGTLDRVRITTAGGADTFDAGTINILYE